MTNKLVSLYEAGDRFAKINVGRRSKRDYFFSVKPSDPQNGESILKLLTLMKMRWRIFPAPIKEINQDNTREILIPLSFLKHTAWTQKLNLKWFFDSYSIYRERHPNFEIMKRTLAFTVATKNGFNLTDSECEKSFVHRGNDGYLTISVA